MNTATYNINDLKKVIPKSNNNTVIVGNGGIDLTIETILRAVNENVENLKEFAEHIQGKTLAETSYNIWHFLKTQTKYTKDKPLTEEIRTPQRLISDKIGDCDDYSIFASTILKALGYEPYFFIVAFHGSQSYGHIYVGVKNFIIDGVMDEFNKHPDNITKTQIVKLNGTSKIYKRSPKTFNNTAMVVQMLSGLDFGQKDVTEFVNAELARLNELDGLGGLTDEEKSDFNKIKTLKLLEGNAHRDFLASIMPVIAGIDNDFNVYFHSDEDAQKADEFLDEYNKLSGLGDLDGLNGWFKKIGKWVKKKTKQVAKGAWKVAKKVAKVTVKIALAPARAALLVLLRLNFLKWASRLWLSYLPMKKVRAIGMDLNVFKKLVDFRRKFEKFWTKSGGNKKALFKAVSKKGQKKAREKYGIHGLGCAGACSGSASAAAASPFLIFLAKAWKKVKGIFGKLFKKVDLKKAETKVGIGVASLIHKDAVAGQNDDYLQETQLLESKLNDGGGSPNYKTSATNNKNSMLLPMALGGLLLAFTLL